MFCLENVFVFVLQFVCSAMFGFSPMFGSKIAGRRVLLGLYFGDATCSGRVCNVLKL